MATLEEAIAAAKNAAANYATSAPTTAPAAPQVASAQVPLPPQVTTGGLVVPTAGVPAPVMPGRAFTR